MIYSIVVSFIPTYFIYYYIICYGIDLVYVILYYMGESFIKFVISMDTS